MKNTTPENHCYDCWRRGVSSRLTGDRCPRCKGDGAAPAPKPLLLMENTALPPGSLSVVIMAAEILDAHSARVETDA